MVPYSRKRPRFAYKTRGRRITRGRRRYPLTRMPKAVFAQQVRSVIKQESKFHFIAAQGFPIATEPMILRLSEIPQGIGASARVGNWLKPTNLYGNITITAFNNAAFPSYRVRVAILQWNEDESKDVFDGSRILEDDNSPGGPWRVSEKGQFTILWSKFCAVVNNSDNTQFVKSFPFQIKMHNKKRVLFEGAAPKKFQLFAFVACNAPIGSGEPPGVVVESQLRYTDS